MALKCDFVYKGGGHQMLQIIAQLLTPNKVHPPPWSRGHAPLKKNCWPKNGFKMWFCVQFSLKSNEMYFIFVY